MSCIVIIDGREAVPVRAIPFITGWRTFSPDAVAMGLALQCEWGRLEGLTAYHIAEDGCIHKMLPKEWDGVTSGLAALSKLLKKEDPDAEVSYPEWREKSILCLPSHCFVWLDEFERVHKRAMDRLHIVNERAGDRQLNYFPRIPATVKAEVFEGLPHSSPAPAAPITERITAAVSTSDSIPPPLVNKREQSPDSDTRVPRERSAVTNEIADCISLLPEIPKLLRLLPAATKIYLELGPRGKQAVVIPILMDRLGVSAHEAKAIDLHLRQDNQRFRNFRPKGKKANPRAGCSAP